MIKQIKEDMKTAMKNKDKERLSTIRLLLATMANERIKLQKEELSNDDVITCVNRNIKQVDQEIESLKSAGRESTLQEGQKEVLMGYLPKQLTEEEIVELVEQAVSEVGKSKGNMGLVMSKLSSLKGRADMKFVSKLVRESL